MLEDAPWLVRYSTSGVAEPFNIDPAVVDAEVGSPLDFAVLADGTVMLGQLPSGGVRGIRLDHLDATGAVLGTTMLPEPPVEFADFIGFATTTSGRVFVGMLAGYPGGALDMRLEVYEIDSAGKLAPEPLVSPLYGEVQVGNVRQFAVDDLEQVVWCGGSDGTVEIEIAGKLHELADGLDPGLVGGFGPDGSGGWFLSIGAGQPKLKASATYSHTLYRFDADGDESWQALAWVDAEGPHYAADYQYTSATILADSFIVAAPTGMFEESARVARYTLDGQFVQTLFTSTSDGPGPRFVTSVSDYGALFLIQRMNDYSLLRLDFRPLP